MREIPDIYRYAVIAILFVILMLILRGLGSGPAAIAPDLPGSEGGKAENTVVPELDFYSPLPESMPDLNEGYLFNQERLFEEEDFNAGGPGGSGMIGSVDLEEVVYAGSLITGDVRKALITYQEAAPVRQRVVSRRQGAQARKSSAPKTYRHKQLDLGEDFMGYKVASIEIDRIVFERADEKIEKFLYDGSKDRVVVHSAVSTGTPKTSVPVRPVAPVVAERGQTPAASRAGQPVTSRTRTVSPPVTAATGAGRAPSGPASPRTRRSQRFLGLDPSMLMPPPSTASPQHQAQPR